MPPKPKTSPAAGRHVALLRGVNVGGNNKLPMKDLAAMFVAAGCADVTTYIQSGNVVFSARPALATKVPALVEKALQEELGLRVPVVTRTAAELREVIEHNPFLDHAETEKLHVAFLASAPSIERVAALDQKRSPSEELVLRGRDLYLRLPLGVGQSKLSNVFLDKTLGTTSTLRNWKTVTKLLELAS